MHIPVSKEQLKEFFTSLIDSRETERVIMGLDPRSFSAADHVQGAIVALQDAVVTFQSARYGLVEAQAHLLAFGLDGSGNPTPAALFYAQYYIEDAILRLPRAADLVARSLLLYLEIPPKNVESEADEASGLAPAFSRYLARKLKDSLLARAFGRLTDSVDWKFVLHYRDCWWRGELIHSHGCGIAHSRQVGWDILEEPNLARIQRDFGSLQISPAVRRAHPDYGLTTLFTHTKGAYNGLVTLLHTVYEELARSARPTA